MVTFVLLLSVFYQVQGVMRLDPDTRRMVDEFGRQRLFHGTNVVFKGEPWIPITDHFDPYLSFSEEDMQYLKDWGLNTIRLGLMWPGAEPTKGNFDKTFFQEIEKLVYTAGSKYGIYSLLDMHQDVLAARYCGEGIPQWAVKQQVSSFLDFPFPLKWAYSLDKDGIPTPQNCAKLSWSTGQFSLSTSIAYESLYENYDGVGDAFDAFWVEVAKTFKNNPYVLGYELINEPWAGNIYEAPWKLIPSITDRLTLEPFYDRVAPKIREVDDDHLIFFESITFDDFVPVGFAHVPGGAEHALKSVLSYHWYNPPNLDKRTHFKVRELDQERLGCGGFLTETGSTGDNTVDAMDVADQFLQSWQTWEYKHYFPITGVDDPFFNSDGSLKMENVIVHSRTYAQAVAGKTKTMKFDNSTSSFLLEYEVLTENMQAPTLIYFNEKLRYANGFNYTVSDGAEVVVRQNSIEIWKSTKGEVSFTLNKK